MMNISLQLLAAVLLSANVSASREQFSMGVVRPAFHKSMRRVSNVHASGRDTFSPFEEYGDEGDFDVCSDSAMTLDNQQDFGEVRLCGVSTRLSKAMSIVATDSDQFN
mmetsp:Transcript_2224/g.2057  ORF Transcript_2224/g.2057 Transcript_2224/m.2057 type:complete len:108 (-) Transcript_2224:87-410(-)